MSNQHCQSCGMPIEAGPYCQYCTDPSGKLQSFEQRLENMIAFTMGREPGLDRKEAEQRTLAYLATMPAWKDHPAIRRKAEP